MKLRGWRRRCAPRSRKLRPSLRILKVSRRQLEQRLKDIVKEFPDVMDVQEFQFKKVRARLYVSCHCTLPDDMPLSRVHDVQTSLEIRFKHDAPELFRVLIHPEPMTDNRR